MRTVVALELGSVCTTRTQCTVVVTTEVVVVRTVVVLEVHTHSARVVVGVVVRTVVVLEVCVCTVHCSGEGGSAYRSGVGSVCAQCTVGWGW